MAPRAGVDLNAGGPRRADAFAVIAGRLIALDDEQLVRPLEIADGRFQQHRLARARRADKIEGQNISPGKPRPVQGGPGIILGEDAGYQRFGRSHAMGMIVVVVMIMGMVVVMRMAMSRAIGVNMVVGPVAVATIAIVTVIMAMPRPVRVNVLVDVMAGEPGGERDETARL